MDRKQLFLLFFAVSLVGVLIYLSRDWFSTPDLQIVSTIRPNRVPANQRAALGPAVQRQAYTVSFALSRKCRLESVQVVRIQELETNRFAHPLWSLVSDSASPPVKTVTYGVTVRGMRPEVEGVQAYVLEPRVPYRLILQTTDQEASYDFSLGAE